jgi:hypothetical protein
MRMTMQNDIDTFWRPLRGNMLQPKLQSVPLKIDHQRPLEVAVAISAHDRDRRTDRAQFIQNSFRAQIAQMPDLIRTSRKVDNLLRKFVVRVGKDKDAQRLWSNGELEFWSNDKTNTPITPLLHHSIGIAAPRAWRNTPIASRITRFTLTRVIQ